MTRYRCKIFVKMNLLKSRVIYILYLFGFMIYITSELIKKDARGLHL